MIQKHLKPGTEFKAIHRKKYPIKDVQDLYAELQNFIERHLRLKQRENPHSRIQKLNIS